MTAEKYRPMPAIDLPDRKWPSRRLECPPTFCSVDLRDGNQALAQPMGVEEKLSYFQLLVEIGFKEIEVGFPSASRTEFDFVRRLIDEDRIPEDVTIQVLVQAREHLIACTAEAVRGARKIILHVYNSTSEPQRRYVFGKSKEEIKALAVEGARLVRQYAETLQGTDVTFEYTPESFTQTEPKFALEVCEAVLAVWQPSHAHRAIINLAATVEVSTPNQFADTVEWFARHLSDRQAVILSVHTHNDRGTGIAASEMALLAGADRVEGTLFGNGERTGNCDLVTLALNFVAQGCDPKLDFSKMDDISDRYEAFTRLPIHPRHPYAGELVFTAFSGSHQDAISKALSQYTKQGTAPWDIPYLPIDPADIGRSYEALIRINSQSGKGGVAHVLARDHGLQLPKAMQMEVSEIVQSVADQQGTELTSKEIWNTFSDAFFSEGAVAMVHVEQHDSESSRVEATFSLDGGRDRVVEHGSGEGPVEAFVQALSRATGHEIAVHAFEEQALESGTTARAVGYVRISVAGHPTCFGVGIDKSVSRAAFRAILSAYNRAVASIHGTDYKTDD